jgi:hypothetical protein
MAISDIKKVDYLWKKIGYGATKTDVGIASGGKAAPNEAIPSPLLLRGDKTWNQANNIPATIPGSTTGVTTVYPTSAPQETTADGTSTANRTWKTGVTDWIPPEFGSTYQVKVYIHTSGNAGSAAASGNRVFAAGSTNPSTSASNNDEWFFDYQSGVLHFIGANLPKDPSNSNASISFTGKTVYVSGARYSGTIGLQNNVADTGDFGFSGNKVSTGSSNADMEFDTAGTGKYLFHADTGIVIPTGSTAQRPSAEVGVLRFNTTTGKYEVSEDGSNYTNLRTEATAANITKDIFVGDGSTFTFTMTQTPSDENNVIVYVDGVMQEPDQNYTISGTTFSFTPPDDSAAEAPHAGARIVVMHGFAD